MVLKENSYNKGINQHIFIKDTKVSEITGIGVQTLRNYRHKGIGPSFIRIGRSIRYSIEDVMDYMNSRKVQTKDLP